MLLKRRAFPSISAEELTQSPSANGNCGSDVTFSARGSDASVARRDVADCSDHSGRRYGRREQGQLDFRGSGSYVLFTCIVPVILGFLGLALIFVVSRLGGEPVATAPARSFLICRMRSKDLWSDVVQPATDFCSHLILTPWGTDVKERKRSQREFFKAAGKRSRLYLTIESDDCPNKTVADLHAQMKNLRLAGFEFYMKGNETALSVKECFDLIDQLVAAKESKLSRLTSLRWLPAGSESAILRSGPYRTLVKPNVLANVYQTHPPTDGSGNIPDSIFLNNFNYTNIKQPTADPNQPGTKPDLNIVNILTLAKNDRATNVAAGGRKITNICYALSLMGIRVDTQVVLRYSDICETVQCCATVKPPQRNDDSRSRIVSVSVMKGTRYLVSYDDPGTLEEKANMIDILTGDALCIAADDADADDFRGKCGEKAALEKAPLLNKMAELARSRNTALFSAAAGRRKGDAVNSPSAHASF
ncbi:uncharacterized protein LOC142563346 [Dermacentor variabilis]|uniref:uncharacterized protein LOC142563346 n=1 Tax=Dermacentor variabilis TaxID=34621 RepID=UPI003F5C3E74